MTNLSPKATFALFGTDFEVDCIAGDKVRFHNIDDTYDAWELSLKYLQSKQSEGKLKLLEN